MIGEAIGGRLILRWFLLLILVGPGFAGVAELERELPSLAGRERLVALLELSRECLNATPDKSLDYASQALALARQLGDRAQEGTAFVRISAVHLLHFDLVKAQETLKRADELARVTGDRGLRAAVTYVFGRLERRQGNLKVALDRFEAAREMFRKLGDKRGEADCWNSAGIVRYYLGDPNGALENYRQAQRGFADLGLTLETAHAYNNIGLILHDRGDYAQALDHFGRALVLFRQAGSKEYVWSALCNLGMANRSIEDIGRAIDYYRQAQSVAEEIGNRAAGVKILVNIGNIYLDAGDLPRALECFRLAIQRNRQIGDRLGQAYATFKLGETHLVRKEPEKALMAAEEAHSLYRAMQNSQGIVDSLALLGKAALARGESERALSYFRQALEANRGDEVKARTADLLVLIGSIQLGRRQLGEAEASLTRAREVAAELGNKSSQIASGKLLVDLYTARGDPARGNAALRRVLELTEAAAREEGAVKVAKLTARYESEKMKGEIELLKKQNEIKNLELGLRSADLARQKLLRNLLVLLSLLILIMLGLLFHRYRGLLLFWKKKNYIGHYRLVEKIGAGGMGSVYKAQNMLNKSGHFALKIIRDEFSRDSVQKRRFKHESLIIDGLDHANIVRIVERGEWEGNLYLVMEYLDGMSLRHWMEQRGRLDVADVLAIARQIASALAAVHEKRVIHRDLKPENVMLVERHGDPRFVKLLDFGLAKSQQLTQLTESGTLLGTLGYLSPEQVAGKQTLTGAVDVFALAVILYEMIGGRHPFVIDTPILTMSRILRDHPPLLRTICPEVSPELDQLIQAMMDKDPEKRPTVVEVERRLAMESSRKTGQGKGGNEECAWPESNGQPLDS